MKTLMRLLRGDQGATAAEFALVLPLLLILIFGIIDGGRFLWEFTEAQKATQMGVRYAVVTDPVASGLSSYSFAITDGITQGNAVPTANFDSATCGSTGTCACVGGGICDSIGRDGTEFQGIVDRMAAIYPSISANNVQVIYKNVGLGFAGNPDGPDVSALVTVRLTGLNFYPITCLVFPCSIAMPDFAASLTLEDASNNGEDPPIAN